MSGTEAAGLATLAEKAGTTFILALFVDLRASRAPSSCRSSRSMNWTPTGSASPATRSAPWARSRRTPTSWRCQTRIVHPDALRQGGPGHRPLRSPTSREPWQYAPRVILRKAMLDRRRAQAVDAFVGAEVEYFLRRPGRRRHPGHRRPGDNAARPCYDARGVTRMYDHLAAVSRAMNRARVGQLRQRPRGRQRPVRAELRLRRRADDRRPGRDTALPDLHARPRARHDRHLHAQALRRPDRLGPALAPLVVATPGSPRFPADADARGLGLSPDGVLLRRRLCSSMLGAAGGDRADGELLQAHRGGHRPRRARRGHRASRRTAGTTALTCRGVPDQHRIELRGGDGSANPYLAIAAGAIGAGLDGIERDLDPGASRRQTAESGGAPAAHCYTQ